MPKYKAQKYSIFYPSTIELMDYKGLLYKGHKDVPSAMTNSKMIMQIPFFYIAILLAELLGYRINTGFLLLIFVVLVSSHIWMINNFLKAYRQWSPTLTSEEKAGYWHIYWFRWLKFYLLMGVVALILVSLAILLANLS